MILIDGQVEVPNGVIPIRVSSDEFTEVFNKAVQPDGVGTTLHSYSMSCDLDDKRTAVVVLLTGENVYYVEE